MTGGGSETPPYRVGYGRPPKDTRFKPGQSGIRADASAAPATSIVFWRAFCPSASR